MIDHLTAETLSAHLDHELSAPERRRTEEHLGECPDCRRELEGLRRTVRRLRELERLAPPEIIGSQIRRQVALEREETVLAGRFRRDRFRIPVESSSLLAFSLVVALAVILYLFAGALENRRSRTIPVDLGPASGERAAAVANPERELPLREWTWDGSEWEAVERTEASTRPIQEVRRGSRDWAELVALHPELESLPSADRELLVRLRGEGRFQVLPATAVPER